MRYLVFDTVEEAKTALDKLNQALGYPNPFNNAMTYTHIRPHNKNQTALLVLEDPVYHAHRDLFKASKRALLGVKHEHFANVV